MTRFRQELRRGLPVPEAAATAVGTAGSAVVTAGLTVVIALAGLVVAGIPFLTEMGLAAAGTIIIAVLVLIWAGVNLVLDLRRKKNDDALVADRPAHQASRRRQEPGGAR